MVLFWCCKAYRQTTSSDRVCHEFKQLREGVGSNNAADFRATLTKTKMVDLKTVAKLNNITVKGDRRRRKNWENAILQAALENEGPTILDRWGPFADELDLTTKINVFASLRFPKSPPRRPPFGAMREAKILKQALAPHGVCLHIIDINAGSNITKTVFETMEMCDAFIVFGCIDYGEKTGNSAATDKEVLFWENNMKGKKGKMILIRLCPFDQEFKHICARRIFGMNDLVLRWIKGKSMPPTLTSSVCKALGM